MSKMPRVRGKTRICFCHLILILTVLSITVPSVLVHCDDETSLKISDAEATVGQAFGAVLEAEHAGANVSSLLLELNNAGALLAEAEMAYNAGENELAANSANQCSAIAIRVQDEASILKISAVADSEATLRERVLFSLISAPVFVMVLVSLWFLLKRSYFSRILKLRPEVSSDA